MNVTEPPRPTRYVQTQMTSRAPGIRVKEGRDGLPGISLRDRIPGLRRRAADGVRGGEVEWRSSEVRD